MSLLINWLVSTVAILISAYVLPGVTVEGFVPALVAAVVLGAVNMVLKPLLLILTLPVNILTLGLFTFVINGFLIVLVAKLVPGFKVNGFWWALLFSLVLTLVQWVLQGFSGRAKVV